LETGAQGVSYTTGVPAALGAKMMITGKWKGTGVFNVEAFDPDPFLEDLAKNGLIWHEIKEVNLGMD
jgi:saccharopine dehydrogenase (NAD+, L-lysine-forming)